MTPGTRSTVSSLPPFERVVELHGPALLRFCAAQVGSSRAEDCFQESMLAALRAYAGVRDADSIKPWIFAIAARKAIDMHRATARTPAAASDVGELASHDADPPDDALRSRIRALPDKQREAVTLRYFGGLSHREIAVVMDTSEDAARRNVFEALRRLRKELAP
jgi:RNA polymerase sigma factor (sigma-70 family)